ncbi:hypothetical protein KR093_001193, partial [Drosophila rubida]
IMSLAALAREGVIAAILMGIGDVVGQLMLEDKPIKDYSLGRTLRFSAIGLCFCGPILRLWYTKLDTLVAKDQSFFTRSMKKMALDQTLFDPPFILGMLYIVPWVNGESHNDIIRQIRNQYFSIVQRSFMLWPVAQVINFTFIPLRFQVTYVQAVFLIWNCYLSIKLNQ